MGPRAAWLIVLLAACGDDGPSGPRTLVAEIFQGRTEVRTITLDPQDTNVVRYDADVLLPPPADDTFYVVRVDRAGPGDPVVEKNLPAFTNPIFAHVD